MIRKRASSFKPRLDQLEDRCCPSIVNPALVFVGPGKSNGTDLYLTTADGLSTQRLTTSTFQNDSPSWSPDGTQIAFLRHPDPTKACADLDVVTPGYQGMIALTEVVNTLINGQAISNNDIFVLNVTIDASGAIQTGQLTDVTNTPGNGVHNEKYPEWSPDGRSIAYSEE